MAVGNHTESLSIGGRIMQRNVNLTADNDAGYGGASAPIELAVPSAVTSWVKTDADQAAGDVAAESDVADGLVDVYWNGGMRYGVTADRTSNSVTFDGGTGDDFPESADVTVVCVNQKQVNVSIDGDLASAVGVLATVPAHADFQDAAGDSIRAVELTANEPDMWDSEEATNPYTGDPITKAMVSNGTLKWATSTSYAVGDIVQENSTLYKCLVAHTSGTFATDLAAGDWQNTTATFEVIVLQDSTP